MRVVLGVIGLLLLLMGAISLYDWVNVMLLAENIMQQQYGVMSLLTACSGLGLGALCLGAAAMLEELQKTRKKAAEHLNWLRGTHQPSDD